MLEEPNSCRSGEIGSFSLGYTLWLGLARKVTNLIREELAHGPYETGLDHVVWSAGFDSEIDYRTDPAALGCGQDQLRIGASQCGTVSRKVDAIVAVLDGTHIDLLFAGGAPSVELIGRKAMVEAVLAQRRHHTRAE